MADYQKAYLREKELRKRAEQLLEDKARALYDSYEQLNQVHEDMKQQQERLIVSEKMASLGILSAGVAHEINNPIGFVSANLNAIGEAFQAFRQFVEQLENDMASDVTIPSARIRDAISQHDLRYLLDDFDALSDETREGLNRVKQIVADLKAFVHEGDVKKQPLDINECVRGAINILNNQLKYHARLEVSYGELPTIQGYGGKLNQVFTNLIANASQAVSDNGVIEIRTYCDEQQLCIDVRDNGCGMSDEVCKQLFTPFFTTKPVGQGTGLGLSISLGVIEEHGGTIRVDSQPGQGSCFTVVLPIHPENSRYTYY
ncbi:sensor histidine kinase [Bacterioplanoides sp.]|uniref:sensor histidine kinase n=1 Tax=Bacterioplanoides sp. TaxID=2066072 RepID=UPI003AFF7ADC